jgi:hypothetical protein
MKLHFRNDEYVTPPGSLYQILSHPFYGDRKSIEVSIFNEHRYAFFFWNKWTQKLINNDLINYPPSLITLDWHQDLIYPIDIEKDWLNDLDLNNNKDVALYSWANLRSLNDSHIMAAAYLNIIGDVYVLCRQGHFENDWKDEFINDKFGKIHKVVKFKEYTDLTNYLLDSDENNVYFDIDLDFFTLNNPLQSGSRARKYNYVSNKKINEMLNYNNPLIQWIFQRLQGITIATEPEHTGGLLKSNKLLNHICKIWFHPSLFTTYPGRWIKCTQWVHLNEI